ncbi:MAG: tetratricopeptide repeat protein [Candidatus Nitronauta litoralis]|uniref:Tetratricopeptide repeat protein n=1 Tax=Candidatus Nitronauta litoralis TaxID=2705533 RepID=A0A7T0BU66_9BACT|nr:MAG: tetratricopeptide repeat protein [Candidatus Nitronauta litoralis]
MSTQTNPDLELLKSQLKEHPGSIDALYKLGVYCFELGDLKKGEDYLKKLLALKPEHAGALTLSSRLCREIGKLQEAEACLKYLVKAHPDDAEGWYDLGNILRDQKKLNEASVAFKRALELNPEDQRAQYLIAVLKGDNPDSPPDDYVRSLFNPYASRFDDHLVHRLRYNVPEKLARLLRALREGTPRLKSALDMGCGTGLSGLAFRSQVKHLEGVDLAPNMLERARAKGVYHSLVHDSIDHHLDSVEQSYDLFIATDVLIYLGAVEGLFEKVVERSRPGAWFVFSTESVEGPDFEALTSGRYSHSMFYIQRLADQFKFEVSACQATDIREEYGKGLPGHLFVLRSRAQ